MPPIQLADGKEIERRSQKTEPTGKSHRVDQDVMLSGRRPQDQPTDQFENQRFTQGQARLQVAFGHEPRLRNSQGDDRQGDQKTGQGTGQAHIKKRLFGRKRRLDLYESAKGADQGRGRDEKRQGGLNTMKTAGCEMAHFMNQQNTQQ